MSENADDNAINNYYEKSRDFVRLTTSYQYIFEVTKCCGYGEWVSVFKDRSLSHLYENIKSQFYNIKPSDLCVLNEKGNRLIVPNDSTIAIRDFIRQNQDFFRPIYPVPAYIIYRIYYDDGCCHLNTHRISDAASMMQSEICGECVLHNTKPHV